MLDLSWISAEAKNIHSFFSSLFYGFASLLLAVGVLKEYFKLPIGQAPQFSQLIGRALVACILLTAYPEISNAVAMLADSVADKIGSFNSVDLVLQKAGDTLRNYSWSWTSVGDSLLWLVTYLAYFLLYVTVFFFDAAVIYCLTLLYIFSPLLIALYILPQTAAITSGLFRTLFEVATWKIVWAVLANLLWSSALNHFSQPDTVANFITQLALTLMLAFSILLTPLVVRNLISGALSSIATQTAGYAAIGFTAGLSNPATAVALTQRGTKAVIGGAARYSSKGIKRGLSSFSKHKSNSASFRSPSRKD